MNVYLRLFQFPSRIRETANFNLNFEERFQTAFRKTLFIQNLPTYLPTRKCVRMMKSPVSIIRMSSDDEAEKLSKPLFGSSQSLKDFLAGRLKTDWKPLLDRLKSQSKIKEKVNSADLDSLIKEMLRYLYLMSENMDEMTVTPSPIIEQALHCLLLDPVLFQQISDEITWLRGRPTSERALPYRFDSGGDEMYQQTLAKYKECFGQPAPEAFWPRERHPSKKDTSNEPHKVTPKWKDEPECDEEWLIHLSIKVPAVGTITTTVDSTRMTVARLKVKIQDRYHIPRKDQALYCDGALLSGHSLLRDCEGVTRKKPIQVFYTTNSLERDLAKNYFTKVILNTRERVSPHSAKLNTSRISSNIVPPRRGVTTAAPEGGGGDGGSADVLVMNTGESTGLFQDEMHPDDRSSLAYK